MGRHDAIVIGLGGAGSAAAYQLARRGQRVLGLEQFGPAHDRGSSHGQTRIIRQAYFEDPAYVPLLGRAYELWSDLERESGRALMTLTGGLMIGAPSSSVVAGSLASARRYHLPHELLGAAELRRRFPAFRPLPHEVGLFEARGGFVRPEEGVLAHLEGAARRGAELRFGEPVLGWEAIPDGVRVTTAGGVHEAAQLVITPGAWAPALLRDLDLPLVIERQVLYWFEPRDHADYFEVGRFPIFIWHIDDLPGRRQLYGFPLQHGTPGGVKVAFFRTHDRPASSPEIDRAVRPEEVERMRTYLARALPDANGAFVGAVTCMYTTTPDEHFVIGRHPAHPNVILASPCSGHGYKFVSVLGEVLAELVVDGETRHDIAMFSPARFSGRPVA